MGRDWSELAAEQAGVLSQRQLTGLGVARGFVRNQLRAGRWAQRTSSVFSTTTGPLSDEQRLWLGVLHAGPTSLIGGLTAAEVQGMKNWQRDEMREPGRLLPTCRIEPAILLFAGYETNRRTAHGAVTAVVQQRLTTPDRLDGWLRRMKPLRRAPEFRALLGDIRGGAHSLAEVDLRRACRECGIAPPRGQAERQDRKGRLRWTDAEWDLPGGTVLVLEVDGAYHDDVLQSSADKSRHRKLSNRNRIVVSCSAYELRHEPASVMEDLIALGVPRSFD